MAMAFKGRVWKYGDDVNTDVIFPGRYTYSITDPQEMAQHALEDLDPEFSKKVKPGDFIVAGKNFGCGSSREQAATCIKYAGVRAIVAKSFSRLFFRNAINNALPLIQCPDAVEAIEPGEEIEVDFQRGDLRCRAGVFRFPPLPDFVLGIMQAGGLIPYVKQQLACTHSGAN